MPFDGADFLQFRLPDDGPTDLSSPKPSHYERLRWLLASTRTVAKGSNVSLEDRALAPLTVLREARQLIAAAPHWLRRRYEASGSRYCAVGALRAVGRCYRDRAGRQAAHELLLMIARGRGFRNVEQMNDHSTHEQVLTAFDEAIEAARRGAYGAAA